MKTSGIYKITNITNGKYYIGSSKCLQGLGKGRWQRHRSLLNNNKHFNQHLQNSWNKYGESNFQFSIIEETSDLIGREQYHLNLAKEDTRNCYNNSFTAYRVDITDEVRRKMGNGRRGKPSPNKGKRMSLEQRLKIKNSVLKIGHKIRERESKDWIFVSPAGKKIHIHNLNKFCKENGLQVSHMWNVNAGVRPHHKGWMKCP